MRVCIGCQGRFHFFELARQMERLGHLQHLYTGYPRFRIKGLPPGKLSTFPWLMAPYMGLGRLRGKALRSWEHTIHVTFDRWVASSLQPCDVYHCLTPAGFRTHQIARSRYGALTVCDRPSTHIQYQVRIMGEECDRFGVAPRLPDRRVIDSQIAEYEQCDLIFVPSELNRRTFIERGVPAAKMRKLPFGVDLEKFRPTVKKDDVFRVLFVGQIGLRKGIAYLLEAAAGLRLPRFELCLAGAVLPESRSFLERYEGSFRYLGVIPHRRLYEVYSQASVFVLASIEEGLAYVQAEAMACGLPVIATTNTGAEDLFTDGVEGFIVPIRDPEAIREKILLLYHNPELRHEMSKAALRRVTEIGGWSDYGDRAAHLYEEALAEGSKARHAITAA